MGALEMLWVWVCTRPHLLLLPLSRLHHFNGLSVGNKQSLCPLMWGAQEKSEGAHQKFFGRRGTRPPRIWSIVVIIIMFIYVVLIKQNRNSLKYGQNYADINQKLLQLLGDFVPQTGLRPWTPLGDFCPPDPCTGRPPHFVPGLRPWF